VIVADTGAIIALIDSSDRHHESLREVFEADPLAWLLPWAILPEVDYLLHKQVGGEAQALFLDDVREGRYAVEWHAPQDWARAAEINARYAHLQLGLVDAIVISVAERVGAEFIATLDLRHFGAVEIGGSPSLIPRDL
jgi:predicted nucleic acid-binding protein